jgi:2-haloacid dehalogenase
MIKAVLIDIDDTLLDFTLSARAAMRQGFEEYGLPFSERACGAFTRVNDALWRQIERGELTTDELFARRWNEIFALLGVEADGARFERRFLALLHATAIPVEGAAELCRYLSGRYVLCAASNAFYDQQRDRLRAAGMLPYFSHLFISERLGLRKPDRAFFGACLASLPGVRADECVMIGDSLTADVAGGRGTGMKTIWFDRAQRPAPADCGADYVVGTLAEIKTLL